MNTVDPMQPPVEQDLFSEMEPVLVQADGGLRFVNLLVDRLLFMGFIYLLGFLLGMFAPGSVDWLADINPIVDFLLTSVLFSLYIGFQETLLNGITIGKFLTGTRAVNADGTPISAQTAFARGFSRAVPFEAFSALGTPCLPWHDSWTNTYVIKEKESRLGNN
ncbi:RDD family protein [Flaviaesturariibacter amylovorans]|uniref:RDD domain-containing protein n=1 Tax=Flaviaesturariibacter amylovorans TaxID=1084520 RepID=A0ABP8GAT8_9BACT